MIVVLDTNVIVSSLLSSRGAPAEIIRGWEAEAFEVVTSPPLLEELARALTYDQVKRHLKQPQDQIDAFVKRFGLVATLVEPQQAIDVVKDDPDDNRVLECAVEGGASYITTGDTHLLRLGEYQGIMILTPRGFLSVLELEE
jgi:putative PIN family toxin of toxin-antitoxin system